MGGQDDEQAPQTDDMTAHLKRHGVMAEALRVKAGEDIKVKIDYKTNYVNKAEGDTAIGISKVPDVRLD